MSENLEDLVEVIISAGFTTPELVSIAATYPDIDFREIASGLYSFPEQVLALLKAAKLQGTLENLIAGLIQAKAYNPYIQEAILNGAGMTLSTQQTELSGNGYNLLRLEATVGRLEAEIRTLSGKVSKMEETLEARKQSPLNWNMIVFALIVSMAAIASTYLVMVK